MEGKVLWKQKGVGEPSGEFTFCSKEEHSNISLSNPKVYVCLYIVFREGGFKFERANRTR
jgi:hypothetical protein